MALAPTRRRFDNGLVLLAKHTSATPSASINVSIRAGSVCDPPAAAGLTWLLSRVIDRGTSSRSAADIAEDLDSRGTTLTITVTRHLLSLTCTCLSDDFEAILGLVGDIVMQPSLPDEEIGKRKSEVATSIRQDEDNPLVRASESLMELLYPDGHPYGRRTKGSIDALDTFTRERLQALHAERFAPSETTAVIVGDVDERRAETAAARVFGAWRHPTPAAIPVPASVPATARRQATIPMMNKAQADIAYGFTTIRRSDPDFYAMWLMNNVFGQYSIGGRLGDSIRERQGMAYYVSSSFDANVVEGPLVIRAGVGPKNVERAVASIDHEISQIVTAGVTPKELDESRRFLIGSLPRALETNAAIATFLQSVEFFDLGLDYDVRLPDLLGRVTLDDVNRAARRALDPNRATIVVAGPYQA